MFAIDKTGLKVTDLQQPALKLPPALDELETFIFRPLAAKIPVIDSFYNGLVAHNDSLKATIEPASLSGADMLAVSVVYALTSEFDDEFIERNQSGLAQTRDSSSTTQPRLAVFWRRVKLVDLQAKWTSCCTKFGHE